MKRTLISSLLVIGATASMAAAQQDFRLSRQSRTNSSSGSMIAPSSERPSENTPKPRKMEEPYTILQNMSIFARDRHTGTPVEPPLPQPANPETYYAFRGAAEENGKVVAIIEDTRDGSAMRYGVGEEVASGKIAEITLDSLKYERKDGLVKSKIDIGCDLTGREAAVAVASSDSSSNSSTNTNSFSGNQGINAVNNYNYPRNGFAGRGFGGNPGFGGSGFDSGNGFRQRGFGPGSFNGNNSYGSDGGGFRQRGGGGGYGPGGGGYNNQQQDFGGGRRRNRDYSGG